MDRTGPAQSETATELRAGHTQDVAKHPQDRCVVVDIDAVCLAVDADGEGHAVLSFLPTIHKHRGDQTRSVEANLLSDGIGRYFGITRLETSAPDSDPDQRMMDIRQH